MIKLNFVKNKLYETKASLIVLYPNGECKEYYNKRIEDITSILKKDRNALKNTIIADKVIGKVAATILVLAGVNEIYADTMSKFAEPVLKKYKVKYSYQNLVEYIQNETKTNMCPMENKFKDEQNLNVIYSNFIKN